MQVVKTVTKQQVISFLLVAAFILIAVVLLGYLDSDEGQVFDWFNVDNIAGLLIYFGPTLVICMLFYRRFKKKNNMATSIAKAVILGIPLCFTVIIIMLVTLKRVGVF